MFDEETKKGFLVDWDYAEFTSDGLKNFQSWFGDRAKGEKYPDIDKSLKELSVRTCFHASVHQLNLVINCSMSTNPQP
jgi:hypothetical protein